MAGFDFARAQEELGLPKGAEAVTMIAVGYHAESENTPDVLKDEKPNNRREIKDSCYEGRWGTHLY